MVFSPSAFRDLVSGRRRGLGPALLRGLLGAAEVPYRAAVGCRNRWYDGDGARVHRVEVPVVSVGNLTLGGTGKTPLVEWTARWLQARGVRPAIVSRGYGARAGAPNDEALELSEKLPEVPHVQNPDRAAAARKAIDELECRLIVLDDGFQHRRLARDLDVVLIDALEPFGYEHVFPRGTLREPVSALQRADVVCLSRADMAGEEEKRCWRDRVRRYAPTALWCELVHGPRELLTAGGERRPLGGLAGKPVAAFCGIGNPEGFRHTLGVCGYQVVAWREFADHHDYEPEDLQSLTQMAADAGAEALVCTHKDLVKIDAAWLGSTPLWAIAIELEITEGRTELETLLASLLARYGLA